MRTVRRNDTDRALFHSLTLRSCSSHPWLQLIITRSCVPQPLEAAQLRASQLAPLYRPTGCYSLAPPSPVSRPVQRLALLIPRQPSSLLSQHQPHCANVSLSHLAIASSAHGNLVLKPMMYSLSCVPLLFAPATCEYTRS